MRKASMRYQKKLSVLPALLVSYCMSFAQVAQLPTAWTNAALQATVPLSEYPRP
ncbi:MAG TPA: hypothetical protein VGM31_23535 [Puia sp.]